ncbi:MAG: M50 family peptidase [Rhodospirillaceae bacterium]|nr:MAG: M50 family peptidase [Rhodospirillaceae bacterium]
MKTFSESWHRVANLVLALRPSVRVHKQRFRGKDWYVLSDPFNNRFFRVRPPAYAFLARLAPPRTVESVWRECLDLFQEDAPGQEEVIRLLTQVHLSDLLYVTNAPDSDRIFERGVTRRSRERRARLLGVLFLRILLFNPEPLLKKLLPVIDRLTGPMGMIVWLAVVALGAKAALDNGTALTHPTEGVLSPGNLPLLYLAFVLVKAVHEAGHAALCTHFGGAVHTVRLMMMVLTPLPYVDVSSSWAFRSRRARILVGAGGMLAEAFLAGLAALAWSNTGEGTLHALAYNVMVSASVSTVVFNVNPLLRFDGYYILSDLLEIPNLYQRSHQQVYHLVRRHAFGLRNADSPATTLAEAGWLAVYGVGSLVYRVVVFIGIILFIADEFLILGAVMAVAGGLSWGIKSPLKLVSYLAGSPALAGHRGRAVLVTTAAIACMGTMVAWVPFSYGVQASGIIEATGFSQVFTGAPGYVGEIVAPSGVRVHEGALLVVLHNQDLAFEIILAEAQVREAQAAIDRARNETIADLEPANRRLEVLRHRLTDLTRQWEALRVTARQDGLWVAPGLTEKRGIWVERGSPLGNLIPTNAYRFTAVVTQEEAADLFENAAPTGTVRLRGQSEWDIPAVSVALLPFEQHTLPSATLGWQAGGPIATAPQDGDGRTTLEPFFRIIAPLPADAAVAMLHGRSGVLRLALAPRPLIWQLSHALGQVLQKRYRL